MVNSTSNINLATIVKNGMQKLIPGTLVALTAIGFAVGAGLYTLGKNERVLSIDPAAYKITISQEGRTSHEAIMNSTVYSLSAPFGQGHLCKRVYTEPIDPDSTWSSSSDYRCIFGF